MTPAGFWRRYAAWSLDAAIIGVPTVLLLWRKLGAAASGVSADYITLLHQIVRSMTDAIDAGAPPTELVSRWLSDPTLWGAIQTLRYDVFALLWPPILVFAALGALYHVAFEASARQATPGQRALRLQVSDASGLRIDVPRALGRHLAGSLSWLTLNLGHAMAALPPRYLALHDRISATRVVQRHRGMPAWAPLWIGAQLLACVLLTVALVIVTNTVFNAAIESAL
jgi:uncharacterized RDD family membrane protein YckC